MWQVTAFGFDGHIMIAFRCETREDAEAWSERWLGKPRVARVSVTRLEITVA